MWQTRNRKGELVYTRTKPANQAVPAVRNSTLHWLGARCSGEIFPGRISCQTGPHTNLQVKLCTRIPLPLNTAPSRAFPCCDDVCTLCVVSAANHFRPLENQAMRQAGQRSLCRHCQLYEARRHPLGYSGCICGSLLRNGWLCWSCRHETFKQVNNRRGSKLNFLSNLHRDRQGRKIVDPNRLPASTPLCPGCARSFVDRSPQVSHVTYCMSCDGIVVQPSLGSHYRPTGLMPVQAVRTSARIAARYAAMPPLDFTPIIVTER